MSENTAYQVKNTVQEAKFIILEVLSIAVAHGIDRPKVAQAFRELAGDRELWQSMEEPPTPFRGPATQPGLKVIRPPVPARQLPLPLENGYVYESCSRSRSRSSEPACQLGARKHPDIEPGRRGPTIFGTDPPDCRLARG